MAAGPVEHAPARRGVLFGRLEKNGAARITLAPLDQDAVTDMVTDAFGVPPDEALTDLARGAAGNPALVAELISGPSSADAPAAPCCSP